MKNNTLLKGIFMTVVAILSTAFTTTGIPQTNTAWIVLGITVVGTVLIYLAKNAIFPSVSLFGTINLTDLFSGLILAVGSGLSSWAASAITSTKIDWHELLLLMGSVVTGYLAKNFVQKSKQAPEQSPLSKTVNPK